MSKKFQPLDYSRGWDDYWRDHPQGYSPQEQMVNWSGQLNAMIDFFNQYFDVDLTEYATAVMEGWYFDGRLEDIINEALFDSKADKTTVNALSTQLAETTQGLKDLGFNLAWNESMVVDGDWSAALQHALDNYTIINFPEKITLKSPVTVSRFGATLQTNGATYSSCEIECIGVLNPFKVLESVNYLHTKGIYIKGVPTVETDYYDTGSVGIDITEGNTSIVMEDTWVSGFETLVKSNYNSFYNKFINCRFEKAKDVLYRFNDNNLEIRGNRFMRFNNALECNGTNGTTTISKNSFEMFNGAIVRRIGEEQGAVKFTDNYVEIYDTENLPTNFPNNEATGALPGKFGGNTLFTGPFGSLVLKDNELQLDGVFRIGTLSSCDYLECVGNNIHIHSSGSNLDRLWASPPMKSCMINDRLGVSLGAGGYTNRNYVASSIPMATPYNHYFYYDCILGKTVNTSTKVHSPTLINGWTTSGGDYGSPRIYIAKEGLYLQGSITGTAKTDAIVFQIPEGYRPFEHGALRGYTNLVAFSDYGAGNLVKFRYLYNTGDLRLEGTPASLANISLDGLFIPMRI